MDIVLCVKNSKWLFRFYFYIGSFILKLVRLFVKTDEHLILFVSFGGRHFNDNPKCIYNAMLKDERFKKYKLVWAFKHPERFSLKTPKVNIFSLSYFITALKARCWVTNVAIERGLDFKGKNTFYFQTTHTSYPKSIACSSLYFPRGYRSKEDCICSQSEKEKKMLVSIYNIDESKVILSGYPKNDILCNYTSSTVVQIKEKLGITNDKTVVLYAPTYRETNSGVMKSPVDFKKWESILGDRFVVLFRAHPVVSNETKIDTSSKFVYDVSNYPDNTELMIISDILISDYSGIFFEFAVQKKPMFCYAYDYDEYVKTRELNCDIRSLIPGGYLDELELLETIKRGDFDNYLSMWDTFRNDYVSEYGHATSICLNTIYDQIG